MSFFWPITSMTGWLTLVFVGIRVIKSRSLTCFPTNHSMEIGSYFVFTSCFCRMTLSTPLDEDLLPLLGISFWDRHFLISLNVINDTQVVMTGMCSLEDQTWPGTESQREILLTWRHELETQVKVNEEDEEKRNHQEKGWPHASGEKRRWRHQSHPFHQSHLLLTIFLPLVVISQWLRDHYSYQEYFLSDL